MAIATSSAAAVRLTPDPTNDSPVRLKPDATGRESLVAALAARRLDRTLTTSLPGIDPHDDLAVGATSVAALDAPLGGFPRGQVSEIFGPRSSGRTSLMLRMLAAATARGELTALVDALDRFDPASAVAAGVDLERLLWIRGHVVSYPGPCRDANQRSMEQAIKALTLVLQAGNFGLVICDVGDAPGDALRRLPFTTWMRLQRMVEGQQTMCVLVGSEQMARSTSGLTVSLKVRHSEGVAGTRGPVAGRRFLGQLFDGLDVTARVVRARGRRHEDITVPLATAGACRG